MSHSTKSIPVRYILPCKPLHVQFVSATGKGNNQLVAGAETSGISHNSSFKLLISAQSE
jgi:hypothetical protein